MTVATLADTRAPIKKHWLEECRNGRLGGATERPPRAIA